MMRFFAVSAFLLVGTLAVSCKPRAFNEGNQVSSANDSAASTVNPRAYNAYVMWQNGEKVAWGALPPDFWNFKQVSDNRPDHVFYVHSDEFFTNGDFESWNNFIAAPTVGASVSGIELTYPQKNGKSLTLKFSPQSSETMSLEDAVTYCRMKNNRLPTARELFDFCTAGVSGPNYGNGFQLAKYPKDGRCGEVWSGSLLTSARDQAWKFGSNMGYMTPIARSWKLGVRCVDLTGAPRLPDSSPGFDYNGD
jgi:hypothetical protein